MINQEYEVLIDKTVVASNMDLTTATLLLKALFEEYHNDNSLVVCVRKIKKCEGESRVGY